MSFERNDFTNGAALQKERLYKFRIEKKTWGLFWKRVDIGEPNNEWYDVIYNYVYAGDHTFQLPSKGTYRITVVYVISGSGGAPDTITRTIKKTY